MFSLFKRKRKQCCKCKKTFRKDTGVLHLTGFGYIEFRVSPCCYEDYIVV
jgi:hypothetical protein